MSITSNPFNTSTAPGSKLLPVLMLSLGLSGASVALAQVTVETTPNPALSEAEKAQHERLQRQIAELRQNMARRAQMDAGIAKAEAEGAQARAGIARAEVQRAMFARANETMQAVSAQLNTVKAAANSLPNSPKK